MLQICRAEDGEIFQVNATLWDIERVGSLELFLHQEIGVEQDAVLAYLSDGRRLRNDNVRELAGAQDQSIFVFNKFYLDEDLDDVLRHLRVDAPLQPPIDDTILATPPVRLSQLGESFLRAAHAHHQSTTHTLLALRYQQSALRIASNSLDLNVLAIHDAFDGIAGNAQREADRQAGLLAAYQTDMDMIARVYVHRDFLSPAMRKAVDAGERGRTLAQYVHRDKMQQVFEMCRKTHVDFRDRFAGAQETMKRLSDGTADVRLVLADVHLLDEAEALIQQSQDTFDRISDAVATLESPVIDSDGVLQELRHSDTALRDTVKSITDIKNAYTEQCMRGLRQISLLNNDLIHFPAALTALQNNIRAKTSFVHLQKLHNMVYFYGATLIEIVRRKEFGRFFYQRAQVILEVMAKLSSSERKRRQLYRGEIDGQIPWDIKGMKDPVPNIDFSPTGGNELDDAYSLERSDVDDLLHVLDDLEHFAETMDDKDEALRALHETRASLEKLIGKMDSLESGFDRIAERSLLSSSRLASSRRRLTDVDEQAFHELHEQLRDVQHAKLVQETAFNEERSTLEAEIEQLKSRLELIDGTDQERADRSERELHQVRAQLESEATARRILEERHAEMLSDIDSSRRELAQALAEATNQTKAAEVLRQQLAQARSEFEDVKALETRNSAKMASLLQDQEDTFRNLEEARARGEDLQAQIRAAREESEDVKRALEDAGREKDRLLRAQASEHDRQMRDYVAEADGDRAVLEHQFFELRAEMEDLERQVKEASAQVEMKEADAVGLREELQRIGCELRDAQHVERVLREDLRAGRASQSDYEQKVEEANRLVAQLLDVAIAYRAAHVKAIALATAATSHPSMAKSVTHLTDSQVFASTPRHPPMLPDEPSPIDPSDPLAALDILRTFDHDHFIEVITKTGSTIRKWQKQCKEYRERAKGKISFRNFAKGDLALFLPTRNSVSKPWAAFNVSFPHYFLQATGHLADQLKTREWIVARITSITERVVDQKDPSSNPYGLGDGVKYYMLEVEDWTQPSSSKRKAASRKVSAAETKEEDIHHIAPLSAPATLTTAPPENQVEESFQATRAPNSRYFPARARASSTPNAGPSSLSRLLAQAGPSSELNGLGLDPIPPTPEEHSRSPSPLTQPLLLSSSPLIAPPTPSPPTAAPPPTTIPLPRTHGTPPSPLRSGSRASKRSSSSRFSTVRLPPFGSASAATSSAPTVTKAAATTALSPAPVEADLPPPAEEPSSAECSTEDISNSLFVRRRTSLSQQHTPHAASPLATSSATVTGSGSSERPAGGAFASLASWGVPFGRRRRIDSMGMSTAATNSASRVNGSEDQGSARQLLRRF